MASQATSNKNKSLLDESAKRRIAEKKRELSDKSASKFIKFEDGETKILHFMPPYEGETIPVDFNKTGEFRDMTRFMCYDITQSRAIPTDKEPIPWDVGANNTTQLLDFFEDGDDTIEIKRIGKPYDKKTIYRMSAVKEPL